MKDRDLIKGYFRVPDWWLKDLETRWFDELIRQQAKAVNPDERGGQELQPKAEDIAGQAGVDEAKHN